MTTQKERTPEDQFGGAITSMKDRLDALQKELEQAERWLGCNVAANPMGDHSERIKAVKIAEAKRDTAQ